ncbi:MAG TPA: FtsQ-type POTRA domain-containing protein [Propionibacterium sp.]|nr:FtsQ-type POTRA domain-containing protein [Propionibacterium sp.]
MTEPLVDVTGARRRRARARLKRRLVIAGVAAGVLAVIAAVLWVVHASPWLAAREVRVEGNTLVTTEEVLGAAAVPLGTSLAGLDTAGIEARLVEQLPAVATAQASRAWPDAVLLTLTEWEPKVVLEVPGSWVWVSGEGVAFHTTPERPEGVMVARGNLADEDVLATLAAVADALPDEVRAAADHIDAASVDSVTVTLDDGRRIIWGSAEDAELKGKVLVPLLKVKAEEYDVSAPTHPTTR